MREKEKGSITQATEYVWHRIKKSVRKGIPEGKAQRLGESMAGGQGGIRTHGELAPSPVFKTGSFDHSDTCPL